MHATRMLSQCICVPNLRIQGQWCQLLLLFVTSLEQLWIVVALDEFFELEGLGRVIGLGSADFDTLGQEVAATALAGCLTRHSQALIHEEVEKALRVVC